MIKRIMNRLRPPQPSEAQQLISEAMAFPRYREHSFQFGHYTLKVSDFISVAYQLKEYFEDQRLKFAPSSPQPVILDCGANVGVSVLYFKSIFPAARITAFEPDPLIFRYLNENLRQNMVDGVELVNKAVWTDDNGIEFGSEGADGGSVYFEGNKTRLPSLRLKTLMEKEEEIDLLKMDIEGAEVEVITDCAEQLKKVKYLFVEYHSWISNPQQLDLLLSTLTQNKFRYAIHSIGHQSSSPFSGTNSQNGMDIQLDIYAVNESYTNTAL
ncbi:MAG: FkbM family methyltransferase [Bacteroidia bacterium]